ncbi:OmpA family protein [Ottowia sp. VDI28]|uniref:OmpA family protein n=1 Tax=Ottowia sp. VDI28 TaxID=3133968 RepID=UPI003C2D9C99
MKALLMAVGFLAILAGCAPATRVTLLPQPNGRPSAVEVKTATATQRVATPYEVASVSRSGGIALEQSNAQEVQRRYSGLLAVQPPGDERFMLYFVVGGSMLTSESEATLSGILSQAVARPGGEILVIGHTDRVGTVSSNDALSRQRAYAIREMLIQRGFSPLRVRAIGRGEREPAVQTADEVDEPRNRRVEIVVR